jgi:lysophospholipase L1-like esterase
VTLLHWQRYAALGDAGPWATRLAGILQGTARLRGDDFEYADLAESPGLMREVVASQIPRAIDMSADLVSLLVGGGDLADPDTDPDSLASEFEGGVVALRQSGCDVLVVTCIDPRFAFLRAPLRLRAARFNANLWSIARTHGTVMLDLWGARDLQSRSVWGTDRLHLSPEGHRMIASRAAHALGLPYFESHSRPSTVDFGDGFKR